MKLHYILISSRKIVFIINELLNSKCYIYTSTNSVSASKGVTLTIVNNCLTSQVKCKILLAQLGLAISSGEKPVSSYNGT